MEMRIDKLRNHVAMMQELLNDWLHLHENGAPIPDSLITATGEAITKAEDIKYE